jgi:hypothetical protein
LSRTEAHEASLLGTILMPYFLSNSITEAITTDAQSVSGMKPIFNSVFSGASEPAAHAPWRIASGHEAHERGAGERATATQEFAALVAGRLRNDRLSSIFYLVAHDLLLSSVLKPSRPGNAAKKKRPFFRGLNSPEKMDAVVQVRHRIRR